MEEPFGKGGGNGIRGTRQNRSRPVLDDEQESWFDREVKHPAEKLYQRYVIELVLRRKPLPPSKDGRHVPLRISHDQPLIDERRGHAYTSNTITSSRYSVLDFIPKQLLFQATRVSTFYFLCIGIPQTIPGLSTTGNYTTILPLMFFIILTMFKEGYDDYRRHRLDKVENNRLAKVLRKAESIAHGQTLTQWVANFTTDACRTLPLLHRRKTRSIATSEEEDTEEYEGLRWIKVRWHNIKVGDVMKLERDDDVPADMVLLSASGENGIGYVETMALDGETNLKSKQSLPTLQVCKTIEALQSCTAEFVLEDPNRNLYEFNGKVTVGGSTVPLTLNEVIYRGSVLRNTTTAIGIVINTGEECKIRMNANHHPNAKKPHLERYANQIVLALVGYVVLLSVGVSMGYVIWHREFEVDAWYLNNAYVSFKEIIIGYLIMFNNVIPLALYVSLEIVKIGQMIMIHSDREMYDEDSDTPMTCNTNTILENLGQVSYLLSDKTGTLTENIMEYRKSSIAGIAFTHVHGRSGRPRTSISPQDTSIAKTAQYSVTTKQDVAGEVEYRDQKKPGFTVSEPRLSTTARRGGSSRPSGISGPGATAEKVSRDTASDFTSADLLEHIRDHPSSVIAQKARHFILGLALCHTALPETTADGGIGFQAASPDEVALVQAGKELGYSLVQRSLRSITLATTDQYGKEARHVYEILDVIEFSSKRKRMSIIVRCPDGRIWLLCKGADSMILPRLKQADVATRKSHEVRRSIQIEREQQRRSGQHEARNSFGGRPSLTVRGRSSMDIRPGPRGASLKVPKASYELSVRSCSRDTLRKSRSTAGLQDLPTNDDATVFSRCFRQLDDFATEGLRTLLFADKTISEAEYSGWKKLYTDATTSLTNRQARIEAIGEMIEQDLDLLGASAIEDKLQKGVPETIDKLRRANIKIWMLTGDKRETAVQIAHAANLCTPDSELFILDSEKSDIREQLRDLYMEARSGSVHTVAVIDGHTLSTIEEDPSLKHAFYVLIPLLDSVICCRASPSQKANIVKAIRARVHGALTMAIGDGANDIAMIQASHVGVGLSGKEGLQAARVADFSIAQFRFLQRLLLVHGRWQYTRTAKFVLWTFWKESFFYMMQALYQRSNGYTGTSLYENWSLTVLNTLFTSLCVIIPGIFEQDLKAETLLAIPELYTYGQRNKGLNLPDYAWWMLLAAAEGIIVWFVTWAAFGVFHKTGDNGLFALGDLSFTLGIVWTNTKLLIVETHYKCVIVAVSFTITVSGWFAWNGFMSAAYSDNISPYDVRGGFTTTFGNDWTWWLALILTLAILTVMEMSYKTIKSHLLVTGMWPPLRKTFRRRSQDRSAEELDVNVWQEMEKDPLICSRLRELAGEDRIAHVDHEESDDD